MFSSFLIKYAEIGVKGKNRYIFEDALVRQIKYAISKCEGDFVVSKTPGRIFLMQAVILIMTRLSIVFHAYSEFGELRRSYVLM